MPWWSWLVIWACLLLALVGVLAVAAWRLFRKAMAVLAELGTLAQKSELLDAVSDAAEEQRSEIAVLQKYADVQARRRFVREESASRRATRHRRRLDRAKSMIRVDASTRRWFEAD
jgi:hypothetical protein